VAADVAFASFERAWLDAHPEYAIASVFLPEPARLTANAFGCLVEELDAARQLHDPHVATAKAAWWRGELAAALRGRASHPVTRVLFAQQLGEAAGQDLWLALAEATQQTGIGVCSTLADAFAQHAAFHRAAAQVDAALRGHAQADIDHDAALWTISFLLRQLARGDGDGDDERLSIPPDLLARHGLTRAQLSSASDQRNGLLRDYLGALAAASDAAFAAPRSSGLYRRVRALLDRHLIHSARRQSDPLSYVQAHLRAGRWTCLWAAWREARATNRGAL
jgi:phytoene synthase